jgi:hypothetical protein
MSENRGDAVPARAASLRSEPAAQSQRSGIAIAGKSWVWDYAAGMEKSVSQILPDDFHSSCGGRALRVECTIRTAQEAEAVRELIAILTRSFTSHRVMVAGDIEPPPPPPPSFSERIRQMFGDPAQAIEARSAKTEGLGPKDESAVA